jgi:glycerophosphoryl diester phosphodiesterase
MMILAHRGWWTSPAEKNSQGAILRAFEAGYGIETDVRDHDGSLVVAHDPPKGTGHIPFEWVIEQFAKADQPGWLAINIKADGLQDPLNDMLRFHCIDRAFVFDMAVPDALGYLRRGFQCFTRESEVEPEPSFLEDASGVWIDCFRSDWITEDSIRKHTQRGRKVALVSPELHGRPHRAAWESWRASRLEQELMLCTDLVGEAVEFFEIN